MFNSFFKINSSRTFLSIRKINEHIEKDTKYKKKIFISNQNFANSLCVIFLKLNDLKLVLFERNHISELDYYFSFKDFLKKFLIKKIIRNYYKRSNLILTNSELSSKDLKKVSNAKVETLYNPCFYGMNKKYLFKEKYNFKCCKIYGSKRSFNFVKRV